MPRTALLAIAAAAAAAVPVAAAASSSTELNTGTVKRGTVVVNAKGYTLYGYTKDSNTSSACTGTCATAWIPLIAHGSIVVKSGSGLKQSLVGRFKRSGNTYQVTYGGHPLYRFSGDAKTGQQNGENKSLAGGHWYVVGRGGKLLKPASALVGGY